MDSSDDDDDSVTFDSQCLYDDEYTLLEACIEGDIEAAQSILEDSPTVDELNERDRCGRTPLSHACAGGILPIVEMLSETPEVDVNCPDKEGNTPLIYAAQAGHPEVMRIILRDFRKVKPDSRNKAGFTALLKCGIQGRTTCAKLLLYAGANPKVRDYGRKLCAEEWARFCGRHECADEIARFTRTKRFLFQPSQNKSVQRASSEPDLTVTHETPEPRTPKRHKSKSLKRKIKKMLPGHSSNTSINLVNQTSPFAIVARCVSTPILSGAMSPNNSPPILRRPVSADNIPRVEITSPECPK